MFPNLKKNLKAKASRCSFHGVTQLVESEHLFMKVIWFLAMIGCYFFCFFVVASNVAEFYEYPVITNINQVFSKEPEFPMVMFCNKESKFTLVLCSFNRQRCPAYILLADCFIFNKGMNTSNHELPVLRSVTPGISYGLNLELYSTSTFRSNIEIYINNQSVTNKDKVIRVSEQMETNLVISKVFVHKLGHPYSTCKTGYTFKLGSEDRYNRTLYPYFQSVCFDLCLLEKLFKAINKTEEYFHNFQYYFTNFNKWVNTTNNNFNKYINSPLYQNIYQNIWNDFIRLGRNKYCEDICPIECNLLTYSINSYYKSTSNPFATVNIYYEDFFHTEITEIPKISTEAFVSNLGNIRLLNLTLEGPEKNTT